MDIYEVFLGEKSLDHCSSLEVAAACIGVSVDSLVRIDDFDWTYGDYKVTQLTVLEKPTDLTPSRISVTEFEELLRIADRLCRGRVHGQQATSHVRVEWSCVGVKFVAVKETFTKEVEFKNLAELIRAMQGAGPLI